MNHLAGEASLYLRQHANNPVDWHPWGPEALAQAQELDRPIFLSVGYSACHWCHVMEHESFEDPKIAEILNAHFVSIKVDREERPDIDALYMNAVQALNRGQGGWPMSVWLTPQLEPFYAGTYYPTRDHYGRPAFGRLLLALADAWANRRDELTNTAGEITKYLRQAEQVPAGDGELNASLIDGAVRVARHIHDSVHGGFGDAPKFPHALELRLLFRASARTNDKSILEIAKHTLDHMARGGIYDHLGGGFHRYSTDGQWLAPHFEKMLYDNALLCLAYLEAFQATGDEFYRTVTLDILNYVLRDMTDPAGPFYATEDADSEGEEGKFYVWLKTEIDSVLEPDAELFCSVYDVSPGGNWEGHTILRRTRSDEQDARLQKLPVEELRSRLAEARNKLLDVRNHRVRPARDEKIITAWNGLMIAAFVRAGTVLDRPEFTAAAERAADYILTHLRAKDGRLFRTAAVGQPAHLLGCLEDYAGMIDALISLYEATFADRWLVEAESLASVAVEQFQDAAAGGFFITGRDHEQLPVRLKDQYDGSTPSGNALITTALLRLSEYTGESRWRAAAERTLQAFRGVLTERPFSCAQMLMALDFWLGPIEQVAIVGRFDQPDTRRVVQAARWPFAPRRLIAVADAGTSTKPPWLAGKPASSVVATYVCRDCVCDGPLVGADAATKFFSRPVNSPAASPSG